MRMIDYIFVFYIIYRSIKGYANGVGKEIENLCFVLLLLCAVMGFFIISEMTGLVESTLQTLLTGTGFWISISSFFIAVFVFFFMRSRVAKIAEEILKGNASKYGGIVIGLLHGIIVIYLVVLMLSWFPFGLFKNTLQQSIITEPLVNMITEQGKR